MHMLPGHMPDQNVTFIIWLSPSIGKIVDIIILHICKIGLYGNLSGPEDKKSCLVHIKEFQNVCITCAT